ncbi:putative LRR receptor-like serine/threonine-protein kinase At1g07650 [Bidens hawaiensis]|uniref:putative LRR receptor-like serine/threonine-protein kinase At1g07650 n=1 Tax=Bidens hawaiensis TaxID=980011 RepID=UPI00404B2E33
MNTKTDNTQLTGLDLLVTRTYTLGQIKAATRNFDPSNKLGEGGFGSVFKGVLSDNTIIAIKKPSAKSANRVQEFINEVGIVSTLDHPNLVKLYGSCTDHGNMLLSYEYMENNSLSHTLFGPDKSKLTWPVRFELCLGIARGLAYLHDQFSSVNMAIIHRDIKADNVLLDKEYKGKIADFGFAMLKDDQDSHVTMPFAGTRGYAAPEYATRGYLTTVRTYDAVTLDKQGNLMKLVDRDVGSNYSTKEASLVLSVALLCIEGSPLLRPTMSQALRVLEGQAHVRELQQELIASATDPATSVETPQLSHAWMLRSPSRRIKRTESYDSFFTKSWTVHDSP